MAEEFDPNAGLFGKDEPEKTPEELLNEYTFGKNPNRSSAIETLFGKRLIKETKEDQALPVDAKMPFLFKATVHGVLDMVIEALSPEYREEVATSLDSFLGLNLVNLKFNVDLLEEVYNELVKVKQEEGETEEMFEARLADLEEKWWDIPQPLLNGRTPNDAIQEEMMKYGLNQ